MDGTGVKYAGFWIRAAATFIDALIMGAAGFVLGMILLAIDPSLVKESTDAQGHQQANVLDLLSFLIGLVYNVGFNSSKHMGTIGKVAVGIAITDEDGGRISVLRAIGRYFSYIISAMVLMIGYIMVAFHPQKRALHDIICNTYVVYRKR